MLDSEDDGAADGIMLTPARFIGWATKEQFETTAAPQGIDYGSYYEMQRQNDTE